MLGLQAGSSVAPARIREWAASVPLVLAPIALGIVLGVGLSLVLFYGAVRALEPLAWLVGQMLALSPSADPVYTRAALRTLSDLRIEGIAVSGTLGDGLHLLAPGLFVDSARADWALVRLVAAPGGAILARLVAAAIAHAGVVGAGLALLAVGLSRRRRSLILAALALQAPVVLSVLGDRPSLEEIEATGLSFAVNAVLPWLSQRRVALSDLAVGVGDAAVSAALVAVSLGLSYALGGAVAAVLLVAVRHRTGRPTAHHSYQRHPFRTAWAIVASALVLPAGAVAVAAVTPSPSPASRPAQAAVSATAAVDPSVSMPASGAATTPAAGPESFQTATVLGTPSRSRDRWWLAPRVRPPRVAPSRVEIRGSSYRYRYLVNGQPQVIRGMGLNTQYRDQLHSTERQTRLNADFSAMRRLGVNTVLGWNPAEFDETLMDTAALYGLGVVVPFDLDPAADYTDPSVRSALTVQVRAWVDRFRAKPALRMWGLGNEVLHKIVHPSWVGPQDPSRARNARAFSAWLVETADLIHSLDPDHPVTYRSAEDAFVPWVEKALRRAGGGPRPWFAWGTNCYQAHLSRIVDEWPDQGMDLPLWVSEFAPGGMAPADQPAGFREMWGYVRRHPERVLGGAVYTWTRNGPEEIDRTMGLTDDGVPVKPAVLDTLRDLFTDDSGG